tara:strand:- start:5966 stop:6532 length:567 start_codon:yes stop_codon:yes gene_type:complete
MNTLQEFLDSSCTFPNNEWVTFPKFAELYVRKGQYHIREWGYAPNSVQLANFTAKKKCSGAFRGLINFLEKNYPHLVIVVECVQTQLLADICRHMEFEQINVESGLHFVRGTCKELTGVDAEKPEYLNAADKSHWAYRAGWDEGKEQNRAERGLMRLGLGCAGDMETAGNCRQWLAGFHDGLKVMILK